MGLSPGWEKVTAGDDSYSLCRGFGQSGRSWRMKPDYHLFRLSYKIPASEEGWQAIVVDFSPLVQEDTGIGRHFFSFLDRVRNHAKSRHMQPACGVWASCDGFRGGVTPGCGSCVSLWNHSQPRTQTSTNENATPSVALGHRALQTRKQVR